jgi:osmotically-inducible protein OsmY
MQVATTIAKTDAELQRLVLQELKWDPRVEETEVGVQVKRGVVTLTGKISSWAKKQAAAQAAHRVAGVLDVANDLEVEIPEKGRPSDTQIAQAVRDALRWNVYVDEREITSDVSNGWVTLHGQAGSWFQRDSASRAVRDLSGVRGVLNQITVRAPAVDAKKIRSGIESALTRQAEREAKRVQVAVENGVVKLSGTVRSWSEKHAIERAAGYSPGVVRVENGLTIDSYS